MLSALLNPLGLGNSSGFQAGWAGWALVALMIATGLLALLSLVRAGIRHFWATEEQNSPSLRVAEGLPIAVLLACCVALTVQGGQLMGYTQRAADALLAPDVYVRSVMGTQPEPSPAEKKARLEAGPEGAARAAAQASGAPMPAGIGDAGPTAGKEDSR